MPPHPLGKAGRRAALGANKLGWHWWPGANAIVTHRHKTLEPCARWGVCEWGCPEGAKASFDLIYMPQALKAGAKLVTGARVRTIVTGRRGLAEGAIWIDRDGNEHLQKARVVVLCANGIGTARLLLLSADPVSHPDGLANASGLVGKNLMLHPNCAVMGYYDEELNSWRGPAGELVHSMEFYDTRPEHDFARGSKMQALTLPGPLTAVEFHRRLGFDSVWGASFHEIARRHARGLLWCANTEDLPEESNRITLDDRLTDSDGIPAPRVHYRVSENTRKILKFTVERMEELHEAAGAVETFSTELVIDQPGHLLGTARMGSDPKRSVTDSFGRCHDVGNLFIADGSLMVTSGAANPTCTIAALALRVGQHIVESARHGRADRVTRIITEQDVAARVPMPAALDAVKRSFGRLANGHIHHGRRVQIPTSTGYFATMSASDEVLGIAGVKSYTAVGDTLEGFSLTVSSTDDGSVQAIIEADTLTKIRTGAATGVAAGCLTGPRARTVGIIGCGRQASSQLRAVRCAIPGLRALAWCRRTDELQRFCAEAGATHAESAAEVAACDIVIASTTSQTPVVEGRWLSDGALVIAIGGSRHGARELDDEAITRAGLITCDSLESSRTEAADIWQPANAGVISWQAIVELGDIVTGAHHGRQRDEEIIVFKSNGLGAWDLAVAAILLRAST